MKSLLFVRNINVEVAKNAIFHSYLCNTRVFSKKATFDLVRKAFEQKEIWNRAVRIAESAKFDVPLFVLVKRNDIQRIGLSFDHGKLLKYDPLHFNVQVIT